MMNTKKNKERCKKWIRTLSIEVSTNE